jgi:hypothetical protein
MILGAALLAGCGSGTAAPGVDEGGCEHLQQGPAVAVTATATDAGAPAVAADHQRYDVTLAAVTGGNGGVVTFAADAGDHVFFFSESVEVTFATVAGAVVTPEEDATSSAVCTEIRRRYVVPLEVGTYALTFTPSAATAVSVVVEEAGAHAH